ncbi:MAG: hypothetical protein QM736_25390 [Vicinamibacterales bacterium]
MAVKLDDTIDTIQNVIQMPAREGAALLVGVRAMLDALRRGMANRPSRSRGADDEDALFI